MSDPNYLYVEPPESPTSVNNWHVNISQEDRAKLFLLSIIYRPADETALGLSPRIDSLEERTALNNEPFLSQLSAALERRSVIETLSSEFLGASTPTPHGRLLTGMQIGRLSTMSIVTKYSHTATRGSLGSVGRKVSSGTLLSYFVTGTISSNTARAINDFRQGKDTSSLLYVCFLLPSRFETWINA